MTTITWTVTELNCYHTKNNNTNVVFTVHWVCVGVNGEYTSSIYSTCNVPTAEGAFTPYAQLTQDQVLGWIWANSVDKTATEAAVEQQIQNQINPPAVTLQLPWGI
jgi:uncharacterized membrane protein